MCDYKKSHTSKKCHTSEKSHTSHTYTHTKDTQEPYKKTHKQCCTELGDTQAKSLTGRGVLVGVCVGGVGVCV